MVTTTRDPDLFRTSPGEGYDGVVQVSTENAYGSGTLLPGGRAVLTSAHVIEGASSLTVNVDTPDGRISVPASRYALHPDYDPLTANSDLALVWLSAPAPVMATRHGLYREDNELGQETTIVGYGLTGQGLEGARALGAEGPVKHFANNRFDTTGEVLKDSFGSGIVWSPTPGSQLIMDFDNGSNDHDALGQLMGIAGTGVGQTEGLTAPGDSGGPAFIGEQVAGITTYGASLSRNGQSPDVNDTLDSSFGELASFQRVGFFQQWIDQSLRQTDAAAPTRPAEVDKIINEGNDATSLVYFLLEFTGERVDPDEWLSVDYATRNGTATAGEDYLAVADTLILYPGETEAVIPVEVIGDDTPEADETFYLDVFNPQGGTFGEGIAQLTAMRTIIDDDGGIA